MREANLRGLDLNLLVLLDALIDHRSVTRAAAAANMSQPAMSRALGRLRAMLGDPILARSDAGLSPTPRALALQPRLKAILGGIGDLVADEPFDAARWTGSVTLAATDHQTILLLPRLMARLAREAPRVSVRVMPFTPAAMAALRDGAIDLAFGVAEQTLPPSLRHEALYRDRFVTLLRQGHPAIRNWSLDRFVALDHILVTILDDGRGAVDTVLEEMGRQRRIALRLPHFYAALAIAAATDLVVTLPRSIALSHAARHGLVMLDPPASRPPFTAIAIWPAVRDADPANRWLRGLIRDAAPAIEGVMAL